MRVRVRRWLLSARQQTVDTLRLRRLSAFGLMNTHTLMRSQRIAHRRDSKFLNFTLNFAKSLRL